MSFKITPDHRDRQAYVYVRQYHRSAAAQSRESAAAIRADGPSSCARLVRGRDCRRRPRPVGWRVERPGFERLLLAICEARVGIVLAVEASRLARNGRDWHTLLEFCGLVGCLLADEDGVYDPR